MSSLFIGNLQEMSPLLMHAANSSVPMEPLDDMDETASESNDGTEHTVATTATPEKYLLI